MKIEQQRAAFEAAHKQKFGYAPDKFTDGSYANARTQFGWDIWQAAIALDRQQRRESVAWQPIETAPRDGAWVLAINAATNPSRQHVVHYSERHGGHYPWVTGSAPMDFVAGVTHWMSLAAPPAPQPAAPVVKESLIVAEPVKVPSDEDLLAFYEARAGFDIRHPTRRILPMFRELLELYGQPAQPMVDMAPPATSRDRWMYEQGRLAERDPRTEGSLAAQVAAQPGVPDGFRLIAVNSAFDDLMYWLDRCENKGHLENCADLIEPWQAFEYRELPTPPPDDQAQQECQP